MARVVQPVSCIESVRESRLRKIIKKIIKTENGT